MLARLSGAFWNYVSPKKHATQETSDLVEDVYEAPSGLRNLRSRRSMSPASRVDSWHVASTIEPSDSVSQLSPTKTTAFKRKRATISKATPSKKARGRPRKYPKVMKSVEIDPDEGMEGDTTLVNGPNEEDDMTSLFSEIRVAPHSPSPEPQDLRWTAEDEMDETFFSATSPHNTSLSATPPPPTTGTDLHISASDFPAQSRPLITHLINRGHEPLLPSHWTHDFKFLPASLFCPPGSHDGWTIGSSSGADFRAQKAFKDLLALGPRVRDKIAVGAAPEGSVEAQVGRYLSWANKDAKVRAEVPALMAFAGGRHHVSASDLQGLVAERMVRLADEWSGWLNGSWRDDLPVLYGVVISHSLVAVVCFDADILDQGSGGYYEKVMGGMQTVGMFDLGQKGFDVWNALALALVVVHVRDVMAGYSR